MDIKLKTYLLNPIYSLLMSTPQAQQGPRMVLAQQGPRMVLAQQGPRMVLAQQGPRTVLAQQGPRMVLAQQGQRMVLVVKIGFFMKWFSIITY